MTAIDPMENVAPPSNGATMLSQGTLECGG
jgi:hypothetical protein